MTKVKNYVETDTHVIFLRGPFSNFAKAHIKYRGQNFQNTEQAFMYAKALEFNDSEIAEQLLDPSLQPWEAKELGRKVSGYIDSVWGSVRYQRMLEVNQEKYKIEFYRRLLLDTKDKNIIEANPRDNVWSCGLSETHPDVTDPSKWKGRNLLGNILTEIRQDIIEGKL